MMQLHGKFLANPSSSANTIKPQLPSSDVGILFNISGLQAQHSDPEDNDMMSSSVQSHDTGVHWCRLAV